MLIGKKRIMIIFGVLLLISGCGKKTSEQEITDTTDTVWEAGNEETSATKERVTEAKEESDKATTEMEGFETEGERESVTAETEKFSFVGALTEQDAEESKKAAEAYYETAYRKAENLILAEEEMYAVLCPTGGVPGEVVIFQGNEEGNPSLTRYIVLRKSDDGWTVENEGY